MTFNSLCEILPQKLLSFAQLLSAFNSLCEIQGVRSFLFLLSFYLSILYVRFEWFYPLHPSLRLGVLSILYVRFSVTFRSMGLVSIELSILYVRFQKRLPRPRRLPNPLSILYVRFIPAGKMIMSGCQIWAFNSLCEIRRRRKRRRLKPLSPFNSLCEILQSRRSKSHTDTTFQFSM